MESTKKISRIIFSNVGVHDESLLREVIGPYLVLDATGVPAHNILKRTTGLTLRSHSPIVMANTIKCISKFMGDNFNNFMGEFTPEELLKQDIHLGKQPSNFVMNALMHENKAFNGGIKFPETLDIAEKNGVISKDTFFSFCNLFAYTAQQEAQYAIKLKKCSNSAERSQIREKMVGINNDYLVGVIGAMAHILSPNKEISSCGIVDMDLLYAQYPEHVKAAKCITHSYCNIACVNRILREQKDGRIEPDPVITILERDGKYTEELKHQIMELAKKNLHKRTIPFHELPQDLQNAIQENQSNILSNIKMLNKNYRKVFHTSLSKAHILGGPSNRIARVMALDEGMIEELHGNIPKRRF